MVGPKAYAATMKPLRWLSQQVSRQTKAAKVRAGIPPGEPMPKSMHIPWSENMRKTPPCIAGLHARIAHLRANAWHPWTTRLVERFDVMAIEDLNVAGMLKNHHRARAIADMGFGDVRRQIEDQAAPQGTTVIVVSRWYASSKTCSRVATSFPCRRGGGTLEHENWPAATPAV